MKLDPFANPLPSINPTGATGFTGSNFGIDTFNQHTTASSSMDAFNQSLGFLRCQLCCNNNFTNNNNHRCLESIVVGALIHQLIHFAFGKQSTNANWRPFGFEQFNQPTCTNVSLVTRSCYSVSFRLVLLLPS